MTEKGVVSKVKVAAPVEKIWDFLTTKYNWGTWWGSDIRTLDPGWEKGAKLQFSGSYQPTINIDECTPHESIQFSMPYLRLTIRLAEADEIGTEVSIECTPDGATWPDGGKNQQRIMQEKLERLKSTLE
jgi:uncharacterized protein YndB with AHSA1/START domain